jgi:fibronectin type 3 domain-containing protein
MAADLQLVSAVGQLPGILASSLESEHAEEHLDHHEHDHADGLHIRPGIAADKTTGTIGAVAGALVPLTSIPALNSLAGAAASIYLDFDGHFEPFWGAYMNVSTPVFDTDGDATTFSDGEIATIRKVWEVVAEDYAPFNINVTTVQPASFANGRAIRASIGGNSSWLGHGAGGVAYVNSFTNSIANTVYAFTANLGGGYWKYVGEAVSHEVGHSLGLNHQSLYSGATRVQEYYSGSGGVAPIMGNSYYATRGLWWSGTTTSPSTLQDDLAVISRAFNGFGYRADDHGSSPGTATALGVNGTAVSGTGIIHATSDRDWFSFDTGAGQVSFTVDVPAGVNNLDARLELRSSVGALIASAAPATSFGASITTTLAAGSYRLVVASQGNYGDLGQYTVSGTIVQAVPVTVNAPTNLTVVSGVGSATLNWSDNATNETGFFVERRTSGGAWSTIATVLANVTSFADGSVVAGESYEYRVRAANATATSEYSNVAGVSFSPVAPSNLTAVAASSTRVDLTWSNVGGETGYKIERFAGGVWTQIATTPADVVAYQDTAVSAGATYGYRVRASNGGGDSEYSNVVSVTFAPAAPMSLAAVAASSTRVELTWSNVSGETGYKIERSAGGAWTQIATTGPDAVSYQDTTVAAGVSYQYRVRAFNAGGDSGYSTVASVITPSVVTIPNAPSGLYAFINSNGQVQLAWTDNSTNEAEFVVQRSTNGWAWTTIGNVAANSTGAIDLSAAPGTLYFYRVMAYNSAGYSSASKITKVVTPALAPSAASTGTAIIGQTAPEISAVMEANQNSHGQATAVDAKPSYAVASSAAAATRSHNQLRASKVAAVQDANWAAAVDSVFAAS